MDGTATHPELSLCWCVGRTPLLVTPIGEGHGAISFPGCYLLPLISDPPLPLGPDVMVAQCPDVRRIRWESQASIYTVGLALDNHLCPCTLAGIVFRGVPTLEG